MRVSLLFATNLHAGSCYSYVLFVRLFTMVMGDYVLAIGCSEA